MWIRLPTSATNIHGQQWWATTGSAGVISHSSDCIEVTTGETPGAKFVQLCSPDAILTLLSALFREITRFRPDPGMETVKEEDVQFVTEEPRL